VCYFAVIKFGVDDFMDLKLDVALKLAKKKLKEGFPDESKRIYQDILKRFPANKKAKSGLKALSGSPVGKSQNFLDPPQDQQQLLVSLYSQGQLQQALDQAKYLLEQFPYSILLHNICGAVYAAFNQYDAAIDSYKQALKIKPDYAEAYFNMGVALQEKGELNAALDSYKQALKIKPDYAKAYNNMGNALQEKVELDAAIDSYKQALKIKPDYAEALSNLGGALQEKGEQDAAIDSYKQALKIKPDYAKAYNNMGNALKDKGELDAAIDSYKQALKLKPDYAEAHINLSAVTIYTCENDQLLQMQLLNSKKTLSEDAKCNLNFALAKAHDDLSEPHKAFAHLAEGNALRKKLLCYTIKQDQNLFAKLKMAQPSFLKKAFKPEVSDNEALPVFILGMPRSGTTLVEQIISSHSDVTAAGELSEIDRYGGSLAQGTNTVTEEALSQFRQNYLRELTKRSDGKRLVTDKMPQNFTYIALICEAFPEAKIVHVQRDAAATCWSNYKHYFQAKSLGYCYDLEDVTAYYELYSDLMQFWQKSYSDRIYNLNYENLATDQDLETRNLIRHLNLEWEDACLSPQENKRSVRTASQQQVRKKVYQGSSQQWRKYEPFLNGALDGLTGS
jgi:tetratricopeptide (TPR) repeat protein